MWLLIKEEGHFEKLKIEENTLGHLKPYPFFFLPPI
jgi:hypothetical protein